MGGFLGIGTSDAERALDQQKEMARKEADEARRAAEIAQAEKVAKKGQETAKIRLGKEEEEDDTFTKKKKTSSSTSTLSTSLGIGGSSTGVQI